ncbi:ATP-binding protein [Saccharothrix sp. HUAS TT1]|uniref:ATP-binding protein n=1 Tax=unclassified Saccharothrix TaxID=2593673 RepID=UPI00345C0682
MNEGDDAVVLVLEDAESLPRAEVEQWLGERMVGWPDHDVLLVGVVVGELLDNARQYGTPPYVLELVLDQWVEELTVRVRNRAPRHSTGWARGSGLLIVDSLTDKWGVVSTATNTTVWAKIRFED